MATTRLRHPALSAMLQLAKKYITYSLTTAIGLSLITISAIHLKLIITAYSHSQPQAILVLGGRRDRETVAAQLAHQHPQLPIWVSSGSLPKQAKATFRNENIPLAQVTLDYRATDTVTNFTTMVGTLNNNNIRHIYLVTSETHMPRASEIAFWILGSRGIAYTPVIVPSNQAPEPHHKIWRDVGRSLLWLITGRTGSSFDPNPPARSS